MTRPIRSTDIVYSAVSKSGKTIRFALHPVLDDKEAGKGPGFLCRVVYDDRDDGLWLGGNAPSCRSLDSHHLSIADWNVHDESDDRWLDWLARGEPGGE